MIKIPVKMHKCRDTCMLNAMRGKSLGASESCIPCASNAITYLILEVMHQFLSPGRIENHNELRYVVRSPHLVAVTK